jgi:DNA modification methylase
MAHTSNQKVQPPTRLAIIYHPISSLKLDPDNARVHTPRHIKQVARSIEAFGFNAPILIDADLKVLAGHGRVLASQTLKIPELPTISLEHLTPDQARAYAIADNQLTDSSEWSEEKLAEHLQTLAALDLNFSLEATGFTMAEIDLKIEALELRVGDAPPQADPDDDMPPTGPAVCRLGDLWVLGPHKLLCDTALENASFERLLNGEVVDAAFVDPPYGSSIGSYMKEKRGRQHREFVQGSADKMTDEQLEVFLGTACRLVARHSRDRAVSFWCIDWRHAAQLLAAGAQSFDALLNICVWAKTNGGMGALYRSRHELVMVYRKGKEAHRNNVQLGRYGRNRTNIWEYPGANSFIRGSEEADLLAQHPTPKPVALIADAILDVTARRDLVLDCFLGSGTAVLAAERTGRRCRGIELDPLYVDLTIRRWQRLTGEAAVHEASGETFDARAAKAEVGQ